MRKIFTLIILLLSTFFYTGAQKKPYEPQSTCDKVQLLLTNLDEFKGALINDNAYECKSAYILDGFTGARVIVPGKEGKYWTVNMNTDNMQQIEAESKYLLLVKELMKCVYLNSWKGREDIVGEGIYHYNFRQTISATGYYKNILISYYKVKNSESYRVEITLTN
ncbi:MAG TPA: hypothetical protein VNJ07_11915 [Chitinophagales bacterium]|nr:hypothetical protein [Chitinophagales bacterium]